MNSIKLCIWCGERSELSASVAMNLRALALEAGTCPSTDVSIHSRPYVVGGDELLCCSNAWV